ncbi:MAG TPA: CPBP family intramembrane glutamic endopeptidase [Pedobacter sp.]|nr:CPBP family intramembrane glutamic endopeptidase [Pedobacter sp.]
MNFIQKPREENSPYMQLFMLIVFAVGGIVAAILLTVLVCLVVYGSHAISNLTHFLDSAGMLKTEAKILQIFTSLGFFMVPAVFLALYEGKSPGNFYNFKRPKLIITVLVFLLMAVSMPLMEWSAILNQKMVFPEFLKPVEAWMKQKEKEALGMTIALLTMRHIWDLILNLFMIALLPAVAEELMFRGGVQRTFMRIFGNPHVAIWLSAAIFSAIHLQFYGFLPRMLLGAGFGYIYLWSHSLWYAMLAHFLNNAYSVLVVWYMQRHSLPWTEADSVPHFPWYGYVISSLLTIFAFLYFKKQAK